MTTTTLADPTAEHAAVAAALTQRRAGQTEAEREIEKARPLPIRWTTPGTIEVLPALVWPGAE